MNDSLREEERVHFARIRIRDTIRDYVYVGDGREGGDPSRQDRGGVGTLFCTGRNTWRFTFLSTAKSSIKFPICVSTTMVATNPHPGTIVKGNICSKA